MRNDVDVRPDEVRSSGLLKDRIIITYPETDSIDDMVILQAAADEWRDKCEHWNYYCETQHSQQIRPVLVIQVENRSNDSASATEISECLSRIESRTGARFSEYEVVHTFGQTATIEAGGLKIHHVDASDIADNKKIRVVFFKENLSTGWDCPRAETMMSFRHAQDATYIAQLLGRMIRTPLQRHIDVDETLNEVRLFLPHFNKDNVESVMKALQDEEGSDIPADVEGESYGNASRETWGYRPRARRQTVDPDQMTLSDFAQSQCFSADPLFEVPGNETDSATADRTAQVEPACSAQTAKPDTNINNPSVRTVHAPQDTNQNTVSASHHSGADEFNTPKLEQEQLAFTDGIDRESIAAFINRTALITYEIKPFKTTDYLPSLIKLASLIKNTGLDTYALHGIQQDGVKMIEEYIAGLKESNEYDELAAEVKKLNLSWKVFDAFGKAVNENKEYIYYTSSDEDIDRKFRIAEKILGGFGMGSAYGILHFNGNNPSEYMVHVILFAADKDCVDKLHLYAKNKFNEMSDAYRLLFAHMQSDKYRKPFSGAVVGEIIRNEKYTGNSLLQKYYVDDNGVKKLVKNNGELPMYYSEETHPAIISQEVFNAAQLEIAQRYGVEIENGIAGKASYFYHGGSEITKSDRQKRKAQWTDEDRKRHAEIYKSRTTMKYLHYDLSIFIKCEGCGENLAAKKRYHADGSLNLSWECHKHNKRIAEMGIHEDIPRPVSMKDEKLKEIISEVLGTEEFDADIMTQQLSHISAAGDMLTFHFRDGHECCNYEDGNCILLERGDTCVCVQSITLSLCCKWFREAVLPLDAEPEAAFLHREDRKACTVCGAWFVPKSNRGKSCQTCTVRMRKQKAKERKRRQRERCHALGSPEAL